MAVMSTCRHTNRRYVDPMMKRPEDWLIEKWCEWVRDKSTRDGFNRALRHNTRILLAAYTFCLVTGNPGASLVPSLVSIGIMQQGTAKSLKNWLWGTMVWATFPVSVWASFLRCALEQFEQDKAYNLYMMFYMFGRGAEENFGSFCALVLILTVMGKIQHKVIVW